jgi:hypothetical protein
MVRFLCVLVLFLFSFSACGRSAPVKSESGNNTVPVSNNMPDEKVFIGEGSAPEFSDARNNAYYDIMKKAAIFVLGEQKFNDNKSQLDGLLSYPADRKYIFGETEKAPAEKQKKWLSNSRDANGNLALKLQATINIKKLKGDLEALSLKESAPASTPGLAGTPADLSQPAAPQSTAVTNQVDLSGVDVSALSFLVYYNLNDPAIKNDGDQAAYSKWAVDNLNRELSALSVQTFDLDTVEKLVSERNLLHEASTGSLGVGLLLAQKVYAELYAEVTPAVTYEGNKANVIVNVKVFVRTTGALIASIEKGGQQYESVSLAASIKASMREAVRKIKDELVVSLRKYVNSGRFYFARLTGVSSYRDASKFASAAGKIEGVVNMTLKSGSKEEKVYDYSLQFKGNPTDAVDRLFEALSGVTGFEKLDLKQIRGNELTFTLE